MPVRVTIEAASKAEAELIAEQLPANAQAQSWRGFGVIRLGAKSRQEIEHFIEAVSRSVHKHGLKWARIRYGDDERVFRANGRRPADQSTGSASGSVSPAMR
jgi:hypothetical protein